MHYYKFNISDWALHTAHLTLVEEAVYFRLINHYYDSESLIPLETQPVFRRLRLGSDSGIAEQILNEFFVKTEVGFLHNRCDKVLKEYRKSAKKNKVNGAKGGRPKKDAASSITQDKPSGLDVGTQVEPKHNPNYELITNNQELITTNQSNKDIGDKSPAKAKKRFVEPSLPDVQNYFLEKTKDHELSRVEGIKFHSHYDSKGWMVGKNKMKTWKSAVTGWLARNEPQGNTNEINGRPTTARPDLSTTGRTRTNAEKRRREIDAQLAEIERNDRPMAANVIDVSPQMDVISRG